MEKVIKVLVIRFSSIGDIVLTTPVLRCLKQQLPQTELHFCTKQIYQPVLKNNPYIDKYHLLEDDYYDLLCRLRAENFTYVIDLHNNLRTFFIKLVLNIRSLTVNKLNWRKWMYVQFNVDIMPDVHVVDRYISTVASLGIKDDGGGLDFFISSQDMVNLNHFPVTYQHGYVAYAIGGQYATKRLPIPRMVELCQKIDSPIILLGGSEDRQDGEQIVDVVGKDRVYNACGQYTLSQSASLLQQARVVFSHDTGLMHIAAAFKKKVYSIWGNTTPQLGMYPYRTLHVVLEKKGLKCRPCSKIGFYKCPAGHFKCMNELLFTFDAAAVKQLVATGMEPTMK